MSYDTAITDQMRSARIKCPVGACAGMVKIIDHPGDIAVWECDICRSEWHVDGSPRWTIETPIAIEIEDSE